MQNLITRFLNEEDGMGTLEVVVIVAVLLAIALIFKDKIFNVFDSLMGHVDDGSGGNWAPQTQP